ncbi:hypothetical protein LTR56_017513 [Elasticomyces elasticus]|nr:hypothetical protein LTR56_017513 [Elasticomyces elasticus]KAK3665087.1 hypothetical protein LTR22_004143 [Elasticomyces elasticus]KAK4931538.1 hypothetical protein LTR49_001926 [Elasticomyces elasticus]KAK5766697.1 hypothetical protein LTS12_003046 [Elasticomyces elasticus]
MGNDRERKKVKLTEEEEPEQQKTKKTKRSPKERSERKQKKKEKRTNRVVSKVFSIPELRELIVLHLPLRQLHLARSVSRDFAATIDTPKVRRALWLEPLSAERLTWKYHPDGVAGSQVDKGIIDHGNWVDQGVVSAANGPHPIVNPFIPVERDHNGWLGRPPRSGLLMRDDDEERNRYRGGDPPYKRYFWTDRDISRDHKKFIRKYGSSRSSYPQMLLTQPPVVALEGYGRGVCIMDLDDGQAVTVGALFDELTRNADVFSCKREIDWQRLRLLHQQERIKNLEDELKNIEDGRKSSRRNYRDDDSHELTRRSDEWKDGQEFSCILEGSEKWQVLNRGIDEITGWEMLAVLEAGSERLVYGNASPGIRVEEAWSEVEDSEGTENSDEADEWD